MSVKCSYIDSVFFVKYTVYKSDKYLLSLHKVASVIGASGEKEYEILKFLAYHETAKFKGGQSD
jgi:hypothetical protein